MTCIYDALLFNKYTKGHSSVKILLVTSKCELDLYLWYITLLFTFNEIDVSLQKLSIGNKKCDNANDDDDDADDDDGDMIPMCRPCLTGDTKSVPRITDCHNEVCRVINVDREGRIFLSHPHKKRPDETYM